MWRTAKQRKRTCVGALRSKRGSCSSGGVWRTTKRDSTGYCSSPSLTPSSLHELLFIHRRPPPASTGPCSSSLHRALLHRLLFNYPSTVYCSSSPPHHGVLFNHPSTGTPPPSTVHPALHTTGSFSTTTPRAPLHRLMFIQPSTPRGPVHPSLHGHPSTVYCSSSPPPHHGVLFIHRQRHHSLFIQTPPQRSLFIPSIDFSSSSSEGIARSGSVNSHRSIARVQ